MASSGALERVRGEAQALVDAAVHVVETLELGGRRPIPISLARFAVDRDA